MTLTRPAAAPPADLRDLLGIRIRSGGAVDFDALAGLALRDNPRRAHLIVSKILGKHVPVAASTILDGGHRLADLVAAELGAGATTGADDALVIGYCETATGLGHAVAQRLGMSYLHSTREPVSGLPVAVSFEEEHSHAVAHHLQPGPSVRLAGSGPLVLVDDELTTGRTALNTIEALHARFPRPAYVVAALVDARTPAQRDAFAERAARIGVDVRVASLAAIAVDVPDDVLARAARARAELAPAAPLPDGAPATVHVYDGRWPAEQPTGARNGLTAGETARLDAAAADTARWLGPQLSGRVLVVGAEELMFLPTLLAAHLDDQQPGLD
ncbi:MAG TPA: phosphoribosyltransferase domain-containing protein, partial [Nocardioides sp.]|nr:phosphoribosyltransferase domain-containing protein [Nocardioides sp.]